VWTPPSPNPHTFAPFSQGLCEIPGVPRGGIYAQMTLTASNKFNCVMAQKLFQLMNKIRQATPAYLFSFLRYRCLKSSNCFW
jgi:hypothetical protein